MVEVLYELGRIAALPPEAGRARGDRRSTSPARSPSAPPPRSGLAETLVDLMSDGKGVDWLQEYPARLAATTPEDVQEAAAQMLAPASMVSVVVGDADAVEPGLSTADGGRPPLAVGATAGAGGSWTGSASSWPRTTTRAIPILCRFRWTVHGPERATWDQAFSTDDGSTWETNWEMEETRVEQPIRRRGCVPDWRPCAPMTATGPSTCARRSIARATTPTWSPTASRVRSRARTSSRSTSTTSRRSTARRSAAT